MLHQGLFIFTDLWVKLFIFTKIGQVSVSLKKLALLTLVLTGLTLINPPIFAFVEPFYPLLLTLLVFKPRWNWSQTLFFNLTPFILVDLAHRLSNLSQAREMILYQDIESWSLTPLIVIFLLLVLPIGWLFAKVLRLDFATLAGIFNYHIGKKMAFLLNAFLLLYGLGLHPLLLLNNDKQNLVLTHVTKNSEQSLDLFLTYVYFFFAILVYLNYKAKEYLERELQATKDQQITALSTYSQHIEDLYKELRSFRHDYTNVLTSLNHAFETDDLAAAKSVYHEVLALSGQKFYASKYDIANLANLTNPAMKSILSAKLMEADNLGLNLTVEIEQAIDTPDMDLLDLITMLSIFLDNAIEAAVKSEQKTLSFAYFAENNRQILIIENSTLEEKINTKSIFTYGQSSKGDNRGIGLANVKDILTKYPQVSLSTNSKNHTFRHEVRF